MSAPPQPGTSVDTEEVLRTIFHDAEDAIGVSHQSVIRVVNPSMVRMFGFDHASELIGRPFYDLLAPEERPAILHLVRRRDAGESVPGVYRVDVVRRNGERFLAEVRTTNFVQNDTAYVLAILRDVGRDRRTAEALYEAIFTRNTAVKLLIDPSDGWIVDANPAAADYYGWSIPELRRMRISDINTLPPQRVQEEMDRARLGARQVFRFRHRVASGEIRSVEVHSGLVELDGRQLLLSIVQDTTERDALEEQLRQAQKLEAIGRLAGGVAHDFNNLLTLMMSCGDLLRRELPVAGPARRYLDDLMHAANRASELTRQLLAVGQRQDLRPQRVALDQVVLRIEGLLRRAAGPDVALVLALRPGLWVEADPGQLEQVVTNLVLNARDATDGRGRIEITAALEGDRVALRVRDDGHGMDEATRARVFEPFFTTRPEGGGAGLGLASVYGIVTQSGGTVSVVSELGHGATFCVTLPYRPERTPGEAVPAEVRPARGPRARVLVVEDDASLRGVLLESLQADGLDAHGLRSGDQALALSAMELGPYDVLVTDHAMPGRSGVEVARELAGRHPALAVVLISAHVSAAERARLPAGARFLAKPFSGADLARTIRELLAARAPASR